MTRSAQDTIAHLLQDHASKQVLVIRESFELPRVDSELTVLEIADVAARLGSLGRFDFVVVADVLESTHASEARALLGRLKNLHTDRFLLVVDEARSCLGRDELLALTLEPVERLEDGYATWLYDVDHYNRERSWNNPEDWAHPDNFRKFRW